MKTFKLNSKFYIIFTIIFLPLSFYLSNYIDNLVKNLNPEGFLGKLTHYGVLETPTTVLVLIFLFWSINTYLWRIKFVYEVLNIPNINGRYTGYLVSSYDESKKFPIALEIVQTLTDISINLFTEKSCSYSISANLVKNHLGTWSLAYIYQNKTSAMGTNNDMRDHNGTALLDISGDCDNLEGNYYNNPRERGRFGTIKVEFSSGKIKSKF